MCLYTDNFRDNMSVVVYIPLAKEYRLLPLQVSLCREYVSDLTKIVIVETPPGISWATSGGPWKLKSSVAEELGVERLSVPNDVLGRTPFARIGWIFQWLRDVVIPEQAEDRALVLSGDVFPVCAIDIHDSATRYPMEMYTWFATPRVPTAWRQCVAKRIKFDMEEMEPGFLHADKLVAVGDFDPRKIEYLESRFMVTIPPHEEVRDVVENAEYHGIRLGKFDDMARHKKQEDAKLTVSSTGTHLHRLIKLYTRQDFTPGCSCRAMVSRMNENPPAWSLENMKQILGVMRAEANRRGWWASFFAAIGAKGPLRLIIKQAVSAAQAELDAETAKSDVDTQL